ncbi:hypothetical protein B0H19DRAFT_1374098 [Mycena capillaripes]|nr:hypothetical protein B0H19DRAFT_1374098 [Mycena capillaripes]
MAFWSGFGLSGCQARPKARLGQNFGLALALNITKEETTRANRESAQVRALSGIVDTQRRVMASMDERLRFEIGRSQMVVQERNQIHNELHEKEEELATEKRGRIQAEKRQKETETGERNAQAMLEMAQAAREALEQDWLVERNKLAESTDA